MDALGVFDGQAPACVRKFDAFYFLKAWYCRNVAIDALMHGCLKSSVFSH